MKTNKYYTIEGLEAGNYLIREKEHDAELKAAIQDAAHYIRSHGEGMQLEYCRFAHKWLNGRRPSDVTLMPEKEIHGLLYSFLKSIGVGNVESCKPVKESEPVKMETYTVCITGTLDKPRKMYKEMIEAKGWTFVDSMSKEVNILVYGDDPRECASAKVKKAMKLGTRTMSAKEFYQFIEDRETVSPPRSEIGVKKTFSRIEPCESGCILCCFMEPGQDVYIAKESFFAELYDKTKECFLSDIDACIFDRLDAFIPDDVFERVAGCMDDKEADRLLSAAYFEFKQKLERVS